MSRPGGAVQTRASGCAGVGLDVVELARVRRMLARSPEFFVRYFTVAERDAALASPDPARVYAGALAAKEALLKAFGRGIFDGVPLEELEALPSARALSLGPRARAALGGATRHHLSVSQAAGLVWALVVRG